MGVRHLFQGTHWLPKLEKGRFIPLQSFIEMASPGHDYSGFGLWSDGRLVLFVAARETAD